MFRMTKDTRSLAQSRKVNEKVQREAATPTEVLRSADKARDSLEYARAAYLYGKYLTHYQNATDIWVQHGHMLKEVGFYEKAAESYERALQDSPTDADLELQIGHLAKIRGLFHDAVEHYSKAIALGHPEAKQISDEIRLISIPRTAKSTVLRRPIQIENKVRFYLSSDLGDLSKTGVAELRGVIGATNYSYSFAQRGFIEALAALEIDYVLLPSPEIVADIREHSDAPINIHLGFYPPDRIRLLKGAYNILCMAWEFERFRTSTEATTHHAFASPDKMLAIIDEIWSPSQFGSAALRGITSRPVYTVASPIEVSPRLKPRRAKRSCEDIQKEIGELDRINWLPLAIVPRIQATMRDEARRRKSSLSSLLLNDLGSDEPILFCMVFNVHDYRKNLRPLLDAFVRIAKSWSNAYLLLKINMLGEDDYVMNDRLFQHQLSLGNEMFPPLVSDRVWMTSDTLSSDELGKLYDISSFYACSAHAEGQNLPLLEAMSRGVVPVTVTHTAMADYINESNAITVASELRPMDPKLVQRYGMPGAHTYYTRGQEIFDKLKRAIEISDEDYAKLSDEAVNTVRDQFSSKVLGKQVREVIQRAAVEAGLDR